MTENHRPATTAPTTRRAKHPGRKLSVRAMVGMTLIVVWGAATFTGILLYIAPEGRRSGQRDVLFGITKSSWGDIHWWVSLVAVAVTILHVCIDWRTFRAAIRHLTHSHTHGSLPA